VQKIFVPANIKARDFLDAIKKSNILTADNVGGATTDDRTNQVIVTDLPEKLALIQELQDLIDVPQYTRVFYLKYADLDEVVRKIEAMQLKSEPGSIQVDKQAHTIIVRDILSNIQRIAWLVELLDMRQPQKIYRLNSIGTEDDELKALEDNLKLILTQDAYYYIDAKRGLLTVRDTPEVHREIERFLKFFNSPVPQVLIQAELLEVNQNVTLSYGTEVSFSEDLPSAVRDGLVTNFGDKGVSAGSPFGFIDYRKEFPLITAGASGIGAKYLSSHVKAELKAALTDVNTRVLLRPNLIVKNREEGTMDVGTQEPIATVIPLGDNTNQFSVSQSSVDVGLTLTVTPTVSAGGLVEVKIGIINSTAERIELATGLTTGISAIQGVRTSKDSAQTVMIIPDGETRAISGLIRATRSESVNGIPILVKIPWIGPFLFGSKSNTNATRNLLFFITPTIIREEPKEPTLAYDFNAPEASEWAEQAEADRYGTGKTTETLFSRTGAAEASDRRFEAPLPSQSPAADEFGRAREIAPEEAKTFLPTTESGAAPNTEAGLKQMLGSVLPEEITGPEKVEESSFKVRPGAPVETPQAPVPAAASPTGVAGPSTPGAPGLTPQPSEGGQPAATYPTPSPAPTPPPAPPQTVHRRVAPTATPTPERTNFFVSPQKGGK